MVADARVAYARGARVHPVQQPDGGEGLSFSLLLPARHEQAVLDHTIQRLLESSHTDFEIIVIVGHDDPETTEVARTAAAARPAGPRRRRHPREEEQAEGA